MGAAEPNKKMGINPIFYSSPIRASRQCITAVPPISIPINRTISISALIVYLLSPSTSLDADALSVLALHISQLCPVVVGYGLCAVCECVDVSYSLCHFSISFVLSDYSIT